MRHVKWRKDVLADVVLQPLPALHFHHQAQQDDVGVAVLVLGSGRELQRFVERKSRQLGWHERLTRVGEVRVGERCHVVVSGKPASHLGQRAQRDLVAGGHPWNEFRNRVVEVQLSLIDKLQQRGDGECLCHAADSTVNVCLHRGLCCLVGDTERPDVVSRRAPHADDGAGDRHVGHGCGDRSVETGGSYLRSRLGAGGRLARPRRRHRGRNRRDRLQNTRRP
jgi:hypothetical protein